MNASMYMVLSPLRERGQRPIAPYGQRGRLAHRNRHARRGYILVVILALLVLSTTLLVAVGRESMNRSLQARLQTEQVIRRWQTQCCRDAVLPFVESILAGEEARQMAPVPSLRVNLRLGGDVYRLIMSDESAKANVNALLDETDKSTTEDRIRQSLSGTGLAGAVRLMPAIEEDLSRLPADSSTTQPSDVQTVRDWISGWGQIFDVLPPERLIDPPGRAPAERLTLWGNGAVNVMRASPEALDLAEGGMLTRLEVDRLIEARNKRLKGSRSLGSASATAGQGGGADPVSGLLAEAKIVTKSRGRLGMVTKSACHSLWIIVGDGRRAWRELQVRDQSNPQMPGNAEFVW